MQRRELRQQCVSERATGGRDQWCLSLWRRVSAAARLRVGAGRCDQELSSDGECAIVADARLSRSSVHDGSDVRRRVGVRRQRRRVRQRHRDAAVGQQRRCARQRWRGLLDDGAVRLWPRVRCTLQRLHCASAVQARRRRLLLQFGLVWRRRVVSQRVLSCGGGGVARWRRLLDDGALRRRKVNLVTRIVCARMKLTDYRY